MSETKAIIQDLQQVSFNQCAPANYQRATSDRQVAEIVKNFDGAKVGALLVSFRDGYYYIVDGLHRSKAMKILGYTHAPCIVLTGLTYEQEASYFRRQNQNKRNITTFDDFKAGLEAKDEECLKINEIVKANGFEIGRGDGFSRIACIHALVAIARDYGYIVLDETLFLIANTWSGVPKASRSESLLGVAEFVSRYGMVSFSERLANKFTAIDYFYTEAMRYRGAVGSTTSRQKFCRVLVEQYNKGFNGNSKKRLVWED
jgi:hypothetical protein